MKPASVVTVVPLFATAAFPAVAIVRTRSAATAMQRAVDAWIAFASLVSKPAKNVKRVFVLIV